MIIVNRKSKEIVLERNLSKKPIHINVGGNDLYFTSMASTLLGLSDDKYIHFINDGNEWSFYINDDPDGFLATKVNKIGAARRICSSGLVVMILKSFGYKNSKKFFIEKTGMIREGNTVFKMTIDKI